MPRRNPNLVPPGGFRYEDETGLLFKSDTFEGLVEHVRTAREESGAPAGDPEADITAWLLKKFPRIFFND